MIPNNVFNVLCRINPLVKDLQNIQSPDDLAQYLLNSGKVNQAQVNQAKQMWNKPDVRQMIMNRYFT